jgi:hypothetical protein
MDSCIIKAFVEKKSNYYLEINKTFNFGDFSIDL